MKVKFSIRILLLILLVFGSLFAGSFWLNYSQGGFVQCKDWMSKRLQETVKIAVDSKIGQRTDIRWMHKQFNNDENSFFKKSTQLGVVAESHKGGDAVQTLLDISVKCEWQLFAKSKIIVIEKENKTEVDVTGVLVKRLKQEFPEFDCRVGN